MPKSDQEEGEHYSMSLVNPRHAASLVLLSLIGRDVGLLMKALCASLEDGSLLVQRAALDFVIQRLPIDGIIMRRFFFGFPISPHFPEQSAGLQKKICFS